MMSDARLGRDGQELRRERERVAAIRERERRRVAETLRPVPARVADHILARLRPLGRR